MKAGILRYLYEGFHIKEGVGDSCTGVQHDLHLSERANLNLQVICVPLDSLKGDGPIECSLFVAKKARYGDFSERPGGLLSKNSGFG